MKHVYCIWQYQVVHKSKPANCVTCSNIDRFSQVFHTFAVLLAVSIFTTYASYCSDI